MNSSYRGAVVVLAVIASIFLLYWGAPFFIPLLIGVLITYALSPVTDLVTRFVRYRVAAATLVVTGVIALLGWGIWAWSDDAVALWQRVPVAARSIADSVKKVAQQPSSPVAEVKKAAAEIEAIAQTGKPPARTPPAAPNPTPISFWQLVWEGGKGAAVVATQVMVVVFLVFFMLASGDMFKRKIVRIVGETLSEKKITVQMIDEIDLQIRRYLGVLVVCNLLVGFGTWITFRMLGVEYAELWGVAAGILHTAPYFGPAIIAIASLLAGFMQFGEWPRALLVAGTTILVATLVGSVFATWLSARQTRMNTTATFIGLLFFGWIWGLWGILLGIPLLAIVKTICERYDGWQPVAELLSREEHPAVRLAQQQERNAAESTPGGVPNA
ncbi:MAG TPA: AI-2E family transporter [Usitatibacter sp.]|nr:AI-2E family transporter [Usitatibacter sp.]